MLNIHARTIYKPNTYRNIIFLYYYNTSTYTYVNIITYCDMV